MKPETVEAPPKKSIDTGFAILIAIAVVSAVIVWFWKGPAIFWHIVGENALFAVALLPKILGGVVVACALPLLLPKDKVQQWIGPESGLFGLCVATLTGAIIPGGPSVTLPLAGGLMLAGADLGAAMSLVTGWALLSFNRTLIWELSFLPADLVFLRFSLSLVIPIVVGWMVRRLHLDLRSAT